MYQKMYRFLKTADKKWVSAILSLEANGKKQKRGAYMKKGICILLSSALLMGTVPVYGNDVEQVTHTYRAEVGTKNFYKDDVLQTLDTEIYLKDGYVMLPVRTFFTSMGEDVIIDWNQENRIASVLQGPVVVTMYVDENEIQVNGKELPVSGKMETKGGRLFVPLRNWKHILNACHYSVTDEDIVWDSLEREATVCVVETHLALREKPADMPLTGTGEVPQFTMEWTDQYEVIQNVGDGYFITHNDSVDEAEGTVRTYSVIDSTGKTLMEFPPGHVFRLKYLGEDMFAIRYQNEKDKTYVTDQRGEVLFTLPYEVMSAYTEAFAIVGEMVQRDPLYGYIDTKGNLQVPLRFSDAKPFSEGVAAVSIIRDGAEKWGYIDKKGTFVIEPVYDGGESFREGLANVHVHDAHRGYINHAGEMVIEPVYRGARDFINGTALVVGQNDFDIWLIDKTGKKLRMITDVPGGSATIEKDRQLFWTEQFIENLSGIGHAHIAAYYDATGEISHTAYKLQLGLSEGLSPMFHETKKKYGYVDETGTFIIAPSFSQAESFQDGYALVKNEVENANGVSVVKYGIIANPLLK